jgi:predicted nucleic-acid-binding protein
MDKYTSQEKYQKENIQRVVLKLNKKTDADILDWLDSLDNKQGSIKEVIRQHLNK